MRVIINKASQAILFPLTGTFFLLMSSLDGYLFANVHVNGFMEFKHLKKCDLDINQRPLKHEPVREICVKLYQNQSRD